MSANERTEAPDGAGARGSPATESPAIDAGHIGIIAEYSRKDGLKRGHE
jgi:hypothetical protein